MKDWVRLEFTDSSKKLCGGDYTNLHALRIAQPNYLYESLINYTFCRQFTSADGWSSAALRALPDGTVCDPVGTARILYNGLNISLFLRYGTLPSRHSLSCQALDMGCDGLDVPCFLRPGHNAEQPPAPRGLLATAHPNLIKGRPWKTTNHKNASCASKTSRR